MEQTLVFVKPDGVKRHLTGQIMARYEKKGFNILAAELIWPNRKAVEKHYEEHKKKNFFVELVDYIMEGPVFAMILEGEGVIETVRLMHGHKDPKQATPGSIRGDFAHSLTRNIVHASDCPNSAEREIGIWFPGHKR